MTVDLFLRILTLIATTAVAVFVARISNRQSKTAQEKLRLDLNSKRFEIYSHVLDLHQYLVGSSVSEQTLDIIPYLKASREARFLFSTRSGVFQFIHDFTKNAFTIIDYDRGHGVFNKMPPELKKAHYSTRVEAENWVISCLPELEKRMAPYLNFHSL